MHMYEAHKDSWDMTAAQIQLTVLLERNHMATQTFRKKKQQ